MRIIALPYSVDSTAGAARVVDRPWFMLLDSCVNRGSAGRYDVLVCDPVATLVTVGEVTEIRRGAETKSSTEDPFALVAQAVAELGPASSELPFVGGAVGYFGYDLGRRIEQLPSLALRDIELPDMAIGIYDHAVIVDHVARTAWLVVHPRARTDAAVLQAAWSAHAPLTPPVFATSFEVTTSVRPEITFEQYAHAWRCIKRYIEAGDVYQVNFAQRFSAAARGAPWDAYLRLRNVNPAPYSAYLTVPGGTILSSSPERFVQVVNDRVETKPIKGTRGRSPDPELDRRYAAELAQSDKDRAENVMIVDLLRNDLGKCCEIGSVEVPRLCALESYAKVHHLVSTVRGRRAAHTSELDVLRACFPGGSITGAPKIRAMEIIEDLEPYRRGVYCGAIGYVSCNGRMDTNIAIRTLVQHRDRLYCWAGGGIVMDSELELEYEESLTKAAAMLEVFAHAEIERLDS
ncbi:MAG: aminodeoxychorismate synthase component I [Gammaproteobacteria bacterium]|nr:aminodeoxychorismate synthase component I [Gammaproteobacteria bacterium]